MARIVPVVPAELHHTCLVSILPRHFVVARIVPRQRLMVVYSEA